jgi:hypothetical protein
VRIADFAANSTHLLAGKRSERFKKKNGFISMEDLIRKCPNGVARQVE